MKCYIMRHFIRYEIQGFSYLSGVPVSGLLNFEPSKLGKLDSVQKNKCIIIIIHIYFIQANINPVPRVGPVSDLSSV